MIRVEIKPRQDNLFDIWVHAANGELLVHSSQGYENVEDVEAVARLLFGSQPVANEAWVTGTELKTEPVAMRVEYRNGKTKTEQLR